MMAMSIETEPIYQTIYLEDYVKSIYVSLVPGTVVMPRNRHRNKPAFPDKPIQFRVNIEQLGFAGDVFRRQRGYVCRLHLQKQQEQAVCPGKKASWGF
jgi:hypothetical protein